MRSAVVIRHVPFEGPGTFEDVLIEAGYGIEMLDAPLAPLSTESVRTADLLVVMGGPISVNDRESFPFLEEELSLLGERLEDDRPTLGICLGAQLMAKALGADIRAGREPEVGWARLQLTEAGRHSPLRFLDSSITAVLHWHGEVFDLPPGARSLASTPACDHQAFSWKRRGLGLQFHPEASPAHLEAWFVGHIHELSSLKISIPELRKATAAYGETLKAASRKFLLAYLESLTGL